MRRVSSSLAFVPRARRASAAGLVSVFACVALGAGPDPALFVDESLDLGADGSIEVPGQLFVPDSYDPGVAHALFVHLHGSGARGSDNLKQLDGLLTPLINNATSQGFLVYAPQTPDVWSDENLAHVARAAASIMTRYTVDPRRVYVTGISMGGGGAWIAVTNFEGGYAAAVPMAGPAYSQVLPANAVGVPIWNFHSREDQAVSIWHSRSNINGVFAAASLPIPAYPDSGPDFFFEQNELRFTELEGSRHAIASDVLGENAPETYAWLFAQVNDRLRLRPGEVVRFDFGQDTIETHNNKVWNSTFAGLEVGDAVAIPFARTEDDRGTGVSVSAIDGFDGRMIAGTPLSILPAPIAGDGWTVGSDAGHAAALGEHGALRITSLEPFEPYRVEVFGTWNNDDGGLGRVARYTIGAEWRDQDLVGNTTGVARFDSVFADAAGGITVGVDVAPGTTTRWVSINAMWVTGLEAPCAADATNDQSTDILDFGVLAHNFGMSAGATRVHADFNDDGRVDAVDFSILASDFGCAD